MKQIQIKDNLKNSVSKAKLKELSRFTAEQRDKLTSEDRKRIWGDRRRTSCIIQRRRKQESSPYLSDSKLIAFLSLQIAPPETISDVIGNIYTISANQEGAQCMAKFFEKETSENMLALRKVFSQKKPLYYIESSKKTHKGESKHWISSKRHVWPEPCSSDSNGDQAFSNVMSEAEWIDFVETFGKSDAIKLLESGLVYVKPSIVRKSMNDDEAQPKFTKTWQPIKRPIEGQIDAFMKMTANGFMNSSDWDRFVALVGKEEAMKWFEAGIKQATQPWDES